MAKITEYKVPNKIKAFGWRMCQNILPTRENLFHQKVVEERGCEACKQEVESVIHVMWECGVSQDAWAGSRISLQKCPTLMSDMVKLFEWLADRLAEEDMELFLVQC